MSAAVTAQLRELERDKRTGVLRIGEEGEDGAFHLSGGVVTFAESRHSPGLRRLVAASGRVKRTPPDVAALPASGLARPELELFTLLAVFDAAFFLFASADRAEFTEGPAHGLGTVCQITPGTLAYETAHRRRRLDAAWPSATLDQAPIVPVRRVSRQRVILTGLQAELLLNADGRRTPSELATDLGHTAFSCVLGVRVLAAAALLRRPRIPLPGTTLHGTTLPRADLPEADAAARAAPPAPDEWSPVDQDVLVRLRQALEELA